MFRNSPIVQSAPILDQQYTPESGYAFMYAELRDDLVRAQTFTVGLSGLLSGFDVYLSQPESGGTLTFKVYPTISGVPDLGSAFLAETTINISGLPDYPNDPIFYSGDLSGSGLMVSPGDVLMRLWSKDQRSKRLGVASTTTVADLSCRTTPVVPHMDRTWTEPFGLVVVILGFRT